MRLTGRSEFSVAAERLPHWPRKVFGFGPIPFKSFLLLFPLSKASIASHPLLSLTFFFTLLHIRQNGHPRRPQAGDERSQPRMF
jgi:hypothetical protein